MLVSGILGFQTTLFFFIMLLFLWLYQRWRNMEARKEEIRRLVHWVSEESAMVELQAAVEYTVLPKARQCAVCFRPTTTRCSQCKSVHYCSGKCQIIHWRQGHKIECQSLTVNMHLKEESELCGRASSDKQSEIRAAGDESLVDHSPKEELNSCCTGRLERSSGDTDPKMPITKVDSNRNQETELASFKSSKFVNCVNDVSDASKLNKLKSGNPDERADNKSLLPQCKIGMAHDVRSVKFSNKKSMKKSTSSQILVTDTSSSSPSHSRSNSATDGVDDDSHPLRYKEAISLSFNDSGDGPQDAHNGLRKSMWRKVQQLRTSKHSHDYKVMFPYELFVELFSRNEELSPFGLINCGNSCYANVVLQCLAFTRPLTSYLVRGLHSSACGKKEWCFICEFEGLILKVKEGKSPLSPIGILSKIQKIGSHLGYGREEDAHEFLRYAVDAMQSVCLKEARAVGPLAEETTLIGLTFGGYLRSKIACMRCHGKFERFERIMDLTVEIDGDIETLEQALAQFTADEILDGENKYKCSRCKSFVRAKKKLMVLEAPNILTIVLKRFQSGSFEKLNKLVQFPEALDLTPYIGGRSDKSSKYNLYAVVVHKDSMNATSTGHYVCYVKDFRGEWFGVNDSKVIPVELDRVLLEEAYILLYARRSPRAPALVKNNDGSHGLKSTKRSLEAVPSGRNTSRTRTNSHALSTDPSMIRQKHENYPHWTTLDDLSNNQLQDMDDWRFHPMERVPPVDSSSESSSLFSCSDASSCSTSSTKDSGKSEDMSDFLFGGVESSWYNPQALSTDSVAAISNPDLHRKKDAWRQSTRDQPDIGIKNPPFFV